MTILQETVENSTQTKPDTKNTKFSKSEKVKPVPEHIWLKTIKEDKHTTQVILSFC